MISVACKKRLFAGGLPKILAAAREGIKTAEESRDKILHCGISDGPEFLDGSEKSGLQWTLEGQFQQFESRPWSTSAGEAHRSPTTRPAAKP